MKVLIVGDSPLGKTGFGRVNSYAAEAFLAQGWEVATVTGLAYSEPKYIPTGMRVFVPESDDPIGLRRIAELFDNSEFDPDIIYATCDPGSLSALATVTPADKPFLAYVPIEGEPLVNSTWRAFLHHIDIFTCSQYGVEIVKRDVHKDIDYVYHGVDRSKFSPLGDQERIDYRERLGWTGKFVVTCVAQNVKRKQLTRLIEAIAILKYQYNQKDIVLYLHTVPFQGHWLEGWNLPEISAAYALAGEVVFNPLMSGFGKSVPEKGDMDVPGLRELVGSADLFVLPSQVEGFGLPIAEAMAVGTPVVVTKYAAGWEVANLGGGVGLPVLDWEIHKSGTRYANVDPQVIAKTILSLRRDPRKLVRMREQGLAAVAKFDWSAFEEYVVAKAQEVHARNEAGAIVSPETNQGREEAG